MRVNCNIQTCKRWEKGKGVYLDDEGGCGLEEITITEDNYDANYMPTCEDYEERKGVNECT